MATNITGYWHDGDKTNAPLFAGFSGYGGKVQTFDGKTVIEGRYRVVKEYRLRDSAVSDKGWAVVFTSGRAAFALYVLGNGVIVRGETIARSPCRGELNDQFREACDSDARGVADHWVNRDQEDAELYQYEQGQGQREAVNDREFDDMADGDSLDDELEAASDFMDRLEAGQCETVVGRSWPQ